MKKLLLVPIIILFISCADTAKNIEGNYVNQLVFQLGSEPVLLTSTRYKNEIIYQATDTLSKCNSNTAKLRRIEGEKLIEKCDSLLINH